MKRAIPVAAPVLFLVFLVVCLAVFRPQPEPLLWENYFVLSVPANVSEKTVLSICGESGISEVVARGPLEIPQENQMPTLKSLRKLPGSYQERRQAFFTDRDKKCSLYYLPSDRTNTAKLQALLARFREAGISGAGVDIPPSSYPWIIPAVVFLVLGVFTFLARERLVMFTGGLPFLLFSAGFPQYPAGAGACLGLFSLFLLQKTWLRQGFAEQWFRRRYGPAFLTAPALICFLFSVPCALLFFGAITGSGCVLLLMASLPRITKPVFQPIKILPAARIPVLTLSSIKTSGISSGGIILLGIFFAFQSITVSIRGQIDLYLPAPVRYTGEDGFSVRSFSDLEAFRTGISDELPDLGQFIRWAWDTLAFPYYSLNAPGERAASEPGAKIVIPVYTRTATGITESALTVKVFDDQFVAETLAAIDGLDPPPFEKVLAAQGRFTLVSYGQPETRNSRRNPLTLYLLIAAALVSPAAVMIYMTRRRGYEKRD
ncbi:MAG: hypothetical protein LBS97_02235 [Treponema sp.]|jgi:hypothetical protein|nr:hypothetical protein [Treponema sp.]